MICPYCGKYNHDNAIYCEGCGRPLKEKSSNSFISNNKFLIIIGGIILLVILCIGAGTLLYTIGTGTATNQSYSDGKISFNYPSDFSNSTAPESSSNWTYTGSYANLWDTTIYVQKSKFSDAAVGYRTTNDSINDENSTGSVISQTTETNPNGITIYKDVYTIRFKDENNTEQRIDFTFNDKNGLIYSIYVIDDESNYQKTSEIADMIFNSLKLS